MNSRVLLLLQYILTSSRYENNLSKYNHFLLENCNGHFSDKWHLSHPFITGNLLMWVEELQHGIY